MLRYLSRVYRTELVDGIDASRFSYFWGDAPLPPDVEALPSGSASSSPVPVPAHSIPVTWRTDTARVRQCERLWAPWADAMLHPTRLDCSNASVACDLSSGVRGRSAGWTCAWNRMRDNFEVAALRFPGFFVQHDAAANSAASDHTWLEVMRISRLDDKDDAPDEQCTVGQVWFWAAPGSGVWYNVGRSLVVESGAARPGCREALERGYDSVQMPAAFGGWSSELIDCRGAHRMDAWRRWELACPPPHVPLLAGAPPERHAPALPSSMVVRASCECDASIDHVNCGHA